MFLEACAQNQMRHNPDVNGAEQEGYGHFQMTADAKGRCHTDRAFLEPVRHLANLRIVTNALVTRIVVQGGRATGVEYVQGSHGHSLAAGREVIVCSGALNSPHLLLLSGIGPASHLAAHGIPVRVDLPGVGQNLQDHLMVGYRAEVAAPLTTFGMTTAEVDAAVAEFLAQGTGPYASNFCEAGAFLRCNQADPFPDVQVHFEPDFNPDHLDGSQTDRHGFIMWINVSRPRSRGEVRLRSSDPFDKPAVDPRYLSDPYDLETTVDALLQCRAIATAEAFRPIGTREMHPGPEAASRAALAAYVRKTGSTIWHPCGSCKMGVDEMAVVDPALRVRGVEGLRVADASIMPRIVSANTNATCIMIGEKAADLILAG
jgi:choline dehydrogenase